MDVAQVRQVGHTGRNAAQQPDQLDDGELAIVSLQEGREEKGNKNQEGRSKKRVLGADQTNVMV